MLKFKKGPSKQLPPEGSISETAASLVAATGPSPAPGLSPGSSSSQPAAPPQPSAVLTLGDAGEILSAHEACLAVLGYESDALVGQNIRVLLKGGLDNEIGRLLHRHRAGKEIPEITPFRVATLRKDRSEFLATFTTLAWNSGGSVVEQSGNVRLNWAIEIRPAAEEAERAVVPGGSSTAPAAIALEPQKTSVEPVRTPLAARESGLVDPGGADLNDRLRRFEEELVRLHRERDELGSQLAAEQQAAAVSRQRNEEIQAQLDLAKEGASSMEAALKEEVSRKERLEERLTTLTNSLRLEQAERSKRFEQEQISLRQERDQLDGRLAAEQKAATESVRRAQELEAFLARNAAEFERAKAELEQQNAERQRAESSWREQLDTAFVMKKELEGAFAGAVEWNKHVEEQLALLRKEHDELQARLEAEQKVVADSGRRAKDVESSLGRNAAEFDRIKTELEKQAAEREQAESEWREQLSAAKARKEKLETSLAEAVERNQRLEEDLARLRRERDTLKARQLESTDSARRAEELRSRLEQQTAELKQARTQLEKQQLEWERAESKLREQLESARTQKKDLETAWATAVDRNVHLEEELTALRHHREEAHDRLGSERAHLESEWNEQLESARALAKKLETAWTAAVERNKRIEAEMATLRRERDDLGARIAAEQRAAAGSRKRVTELEKPPPQPAATQDLATKAPVQPQNSARKPGTPVAPTQPQSGAGKPEPATPKPQEQASPLTRKPEPNGAAPTRSKAQPNDLGTAPSVPPERYKLA